MSVTQTNLIHQIGDGLRNVKSLLNNNCFYDARVAIQQLPAASVVIALEPGAEYLLHMAACVGSRICITEIINKGQNVNVEDGKGETPLFYAARAGNREIYDLLVEKGADALCKNEAGERALECFPK
jgi:ankyrin repeat protein